MNLSLKKDQLKSFLKEDGWSFFAAIVLLIVIFNINHIDIKENASQSLHNLIEAAAIILSINIFTMYFTLRTRTNTIHAQIIGVGFLTVGLLDYLHVRTVVGLPVLFESINHLQSEYYWLAGRFVFCATMLGVWLTPSNKQSHLKFLHYGIWIAMGWVMSMTFLIAKYPSFIPVLMRSNGEKTGYFFWHELIAASIMIFCSFQFFKKKESIKLAALTPENIRLHTKFKNLSIATKVLALTSIAIAPYSFGFSKQDNLLELYAHISKVFGYFFIYRALIRSTLVTPYFENETLVIELENRRKNITTLEDELKNSRKLAMVGSHVDSIAHDMGNLLMMISVNNEKFLTTDDFSEVKKSVDSTHAIIGKCKSFLNSLIRFSKNYDTPLEHINLNSYLSDFKNHIEPIVEASNVELEIILPKSCQVYANRSELDQILFNLVFNAKDAIANDHGKIKISTQCKKIEDEFDVFGRSVRATDYTIIEISDNGKGIEEKYWKNIFDPFFSTKEQSKSFGLGLSTVLSIMNKNQGSIQLASTPKVGTIIRLLFPQDIKILET